MDKHTNEDMPEFKNRFLSVVGLTVIVAAVVFLAVLFVSLSPPVGNIFSNIHNVL